MNFLKNLFYYTYSTDLTVTSSSGFHLRPVAQFVAKTKTFDIPIQANFKNKTVSAKSVNTLLSLNLDKQDTFQLTAKGEDAQKVLASLSDIFTSLMHEETDTLPIDKQTHTYDTPVLEGDIVCDGVGIARLHTYEAKETYIASDISFSEALSRSLDELEVLYETQQFQGNSGIYLAQKELLLSLSEQSQTLGSFEYHINQECHTLKGGKHEAKITDYQDILHRVKGHLGYDYSLTFPSDDFILVADDLLPSDIHVLEQSHTQGVILKETSSNSHTAILLRASGIASLILNDKFSVSEHEVILDATAGVLVLEPSSLDLKKAKETRRLQSAQKKRRDAKRHHQAFTKKQKRIFVLANVTDAASATLAQNEGAEGIGLLRTEFLFDQVEPTFDIQKNAYANIFSMFNDICVRTIDVGGDKALPYIDIPHEDNPFLGVRGIRLFQTHPHILEEQLHAIFVAAKGKSIKVMFPMVSTVEEFVHAKEVATDVAKKHTLDISNILFGIMIEVPSVLFLMEEFNKVVDFYSIGTNDLTQYLFATERTHALLKTDALSPVVFSALETIVRKSTKPVSICGELAADKDAIGRLVELGLETFSVTPKSIAQTKETIRHS